MYSRKEVKASLFSQHIETPSWAYADSGTRFKVFTQPGAARNAHERVADAAVVHRFTGVAPSVALHIPWDHVDDYEGLAKYAAELGLRIGAINPNLFQDDDYRLGSVCNPDPAVRRKAVAEILECIEIAKATGSEAISIWVADGTNYPGQDDVRSRQDRLADALHDVYEAMTTGMVLLLE